MDESLVVRISAMLGVVWVVGRAWDIVYWRIVRRLYPNDYRWLLSERCKFCRTRCSVCCAGRFS
jgi:hypothetical protein